MFWNVSDLRRPEVSRMMDRINDLMMGQSAVKSHNIWTRIETLRVDLSFGTKTKLKITAWHLSPISSRVRVDIIGQNFKLRYEGYDDPILIQKIAKTDFYEIKIKFKHTVLFIEDFLWLRGTKGEDEYMTFLLSL
jgi:hypothetical protein